MTNEEFWYEEPRLAIAYREAQKLRNDQINQQLWLQGLYNYDALTATLSSISFGGKQPKKHQYAKEPYDLHPHKQTPEQIRQQLVAELDAWKEAFDAKQEGEEWKSEVLNTTSQLTQDDPLKR
jgi:hypothetical protein